MEPAKLGESQEVFLYMFLGSFRGVKTYSGQKDFWVETFKLLYLIEKSWRACFKKPLSIKNFQIVLPWNIIVNINILTGKIANNGQHGQGHQNCAKNL